MKNSPLYLNITCPTKPHLRKFLEADLPSSRKADLSTLVGRSVIMILNRTNAQLRNYSHSLSNFDDAIQLKINEDYLTRSGHNLSKNHVLYINGVWERTFQEVVFCAIDVCQELNPRTSFRMIMDLVLDRYNITETDLSYETLRKRYYRYRKNQEKTLDYLSQV